jgi:choline dehydrogenase-like flavoprotein
MPGYFSAGFNFDAPGIGDAYKRAVRQPGPVQVNLSGVCECLPYADNVCVLDPNTLDAYGIPIIRLRLTPRENERALIADMPVAAAEMLEAIGARNVRPVNRMRGQAHEVGAARMGTDPKTSVLNPFQQTHDIRNLFVMDGSGFPSSGWQNPTLTIMALAVRSTDYLKDQLRQGAL